MTSEDDNAAAQRIYDHWTLVEGRKRAPAIEREIWVAAARQVFSPGERQPCLICGKFKGIAQAHHVVPLTAQYDRGFKYPDPEHVWLCPNHHAMAHFFIQADDRSLEPHAMRARSRRLGAVMSDLSEGDLQKMFDLMQRAGRTPE